MNANTDTAIANFLEAIQDANNLPPHRGQIGEILVNKCRLMLQAYTVELETEDNQEN